MTSEGELNPQKASGVLLVADVVTANVSTSKRQRLIMHCAAHGGRSWVFPDTVLAVLGLTARL